MLTASYEVAPIFQDCGEDQNEMKWNMTKPSLPLNLRDIYKN